MFVFCVLIIIFFVAFLIKQPHYAILTYVPCSILFPNYICLRYVAPALTLHFVLDAIFVIYFFIYRYVKLTSFPLFNVFCGLFLLSVLGIAVSPMNFTQVLPPTISKLVQYMAVAVFYFELRRQKDLKYIAYILGCIFILLCVYAFFEYIYQTNFLHEYLYKTISPELLKGKLYLVHEVRYISVRCSSIFPISISWGGFCCMIMAYFACLLKLYNYRHVSILAIAVVCIVAFNVLVSGSRSPMAYFAIIFVGLTFAVNYKIGIALTVISSFVLILNSDFWGMIISSMESKSDIVGGSSVNLRFDQFDAVMAVLKNSPIWGLGGKGNIIALSKNTNILGAESIWLQQLIFSGLLGVFFQIYLFYTVYKKLTMNLNGNLKVLYSFFVLGWIVFMTLTSSPGLSEAFFLTIALVLLKHKQFRNRRYMILPSNIKEKNVHIR